MLITACMTFLLPLISACATAPASADTSSPPAEPPAATQTGAAPISSVEPVQQENTSPRTAEEEREDLDDDFQRSLSKFDKRLERENAELEELSREQAEASAANQAGGGSAGTAGSFGNTAPPSPVRDAGSASSSGQQRTGSPGDKASLPVPNDISDGQDDDVVARQLREAAENEQDPALREKLWDEYRAYKRNGG